MSDERTGLDKCAAAGETTTSRTLFESEMKTFPDASTATPLMYES